jgi:hypothetical protein
MMMINKGAWIVGALPTASQHPGEDINILSTRKKSACTKSFIESADGLKGCPTESKISSVNQAVREKIPGTKVMSLGFFLDCDPIIVWIVKENSPSYETKSALLFEATYNREEEVFGRITIIVSESNYISLRRPPSPITCPSEPLLRLNYGF